MFNKIPCGNTNNQAIRWRSGFFSDINCSLTLGINIFKKKSYFNKNLRRFINDKRHSRTFVKKEINFYYISYFISVSIVLHVFFFFFIFHGFVFFVNWFFFYEERFKCVQSLNLDNYLNRFTYNWPNGGETISVDRRITIEPQSSISTRNIRNFILEWKHSSFSPKNL